MRALDVDLLTIAGHKVYAPKGVGALYVRKGVELQKLIHGGNQEFGKRAGTESVLLTSALGMFVIVRNYRCSVNVGRPGV